MVRGTRNPLVQIAHRLQEKQMVKNHQKLLKTNQCLYEHNDGPVPDGVNCIQFRKYVSQTICVTNKKPDNCIQFDNNIGLIKNILCISNETYFFVLQFKSLQEYFVEPCQSSTISIFKVSETKKNINTCKSN